LERLVPRSHRQWQFHLTGGALCLDFANTLSWRRGNAPIERLNNCDDLITFGYKSGSIDASMQRELRQAAERQPRLAARARKDALKLRALIDRIFTRIVTGGAPQNADIAALNTYLVKAAACRHIGRERNSYVWKDTGAAFNRILAPIIRSAGALIVSAEMKKLRRCNAADCGWLFVDLSRNQRRRWCDMKVCGNRAKARRHYRHARGSPLSGRGTQEPGGKRSRHG
jgi:predicted RNA-binding Zn ribbon-like protein